jgi:hypothetical protein
VKNLVNAVADVPKTKAALADSFTGFIRQLAIGEPWKSFASRGAPTR